MTKNMVHVGLYVKSRINIDSDLFRVIQGGLKGVSRKLKGSFKDISRKS